MVGYKERSLEKYQEIRELLVRIGGGEDLKEELKQVFGLNCPYCIHFFNKCSLCPLNIAVCCKDSAGAYFKLADIINEYYYHGAYLSITISTKHTDQIINAIKEDIKGV